MTALRAVHGFVFLGFAVLIIFRAVTGPRQPAVLIDGLLLLIAVGLANRMSRSGPQSALVTIPVLLFGWFRSAPISAAVMVALLSVFRAKPDDPPLFGFRRTRAIARLSALFLKVFWSQQSTAASRARLIREVESGDIAARRQAIDRLLRIAHPDTAPALMKLVVDADETVRILSRDALRRMDQSIVPALLDELESAPPATRAQLWTVAAAFKDRRLIAPAVRAMADADREVASRAADALESMINPDVASLDQSVVRDALDVLAADLARLPVAWSSEVRRASVIALGLIRYRPAARALLKLLDDEEENSDIRGEAALALGRMGAEESVADLVRWLSDESLADYVARALNLMDRGVPELLEQFARAPTGTDDHGFSLRRDSLWAMYWFAHPDTLEPLIAVASSEVVEDRRLAADAIGHIIWQAVVRERQSRRVDPADASQPLPEAIAALVARARPVLVKLAADPVDEVAATARKNLESIEQRVGAA